MFVGAKNSNTSQMTDRVHDDDGRAWIKAESLVTRRGIKGLPHLGEFPAKDVDLASSRNPTVDMGIYQENSDTCEWRVYGDETLSADLDHN